MNFWKIYFIITDHIATLSVKNLNYISILYSKIRGTWYTAASLFVLNLVICVTNLVIKVQRKEKLATFFLIMVRCSKRVAVNILMVSTVTFNIFFDTNSAAPASENYKPNLCSRLHSKIRGSWYTSAFLFVLILVRKLKDSQILHCHHLKLFQNLSLL